MQPRSFLQRRGLWGDGSRLEQGFRLLCGIGSTLLENMAAILKSEQSVRIGPRDGLAYMGELKIPGAW